MHKFLSPNAGTAHEINKLLMRFQKDFRPKVTFEWVKDVSGLLKENKIFLQPQKVKNFISPTNEQGPEAIWQLGRSVIILFVRGFLGVFDVVLSCISRRGVPWSWRLDDPQLWVVTELCMGKDTCSNISINEKITHYKPCLSC